MIFNGHFTVISSVFSYQITVQNMALNVPGVYCSRETISDGFVSHWVIPNGYGQHEFEKGTI